MLEDLASGPRELKITTSDYAPFSGKDPFFFNKLFERFFYLTGLRHKTNVENGLQAYHHADSDVVYGLFDSIDRMLRMNLKFWRFPIRIGLGAVCAEQDRDAWPHIARLLSKPRALVGPADLHIRIKPIVVDGEVGHIHCLHTLQIPDEDMILIPKLDAGTLATELLKANTHENRGSAIPVVCVDEFTALMVLKVLKLLGNVGCSVAKVPASSLG